MAEGQGHECLKRQGPGPPGWKSPGTDGGQLSSSSAPAAEEAGAVAQAEDKCLGLARTSVLPGHDPQGPGYTGGSFQAWALWGGAGQGREREGHCPRAMVPPGWNLPGPEAKPSAGY